LECNKNILQYIFHSCEKYLSDLVYDDPEDSNDPADTIEDEIDCLKNAYWLKQKEKFNLKYSSTDKEKLAY
jgi:hypothetical protein